MTLTKADITESLVNNFNVKREVSNQFTNEVFELIQAALESGQTVKISKFGKFETKDKKERIGRNPKTKEEFVISARTVIKFRTGHSLKQKLEAFDIDT